MKAFQMRAKADHDCSWCKRIVERGRLFVRHASTIAGLVNTIDLHLDCARELRRHASGLKDYDAADLDPTVVDDDSDGSGDVRS